MTKPSDERLEELVRALDEVIHEFKDFEAHK
jgi:hypothetical protein